MLFKKPIRHRDLKSLNVLLDKHYPPKINDFGLSKVKMESTSATNGMKGTLRWNPPELIKGEVRQHSEPTDVYSYGMVLWELASRKMPYHEQHNDMIVGMWISNGKKEKIPNATPISMPKLIGKCWEDRSARPTAKAAVKELEQAQDAKATTNSIDYRDNLASDNNLANQSTLSRGYRNNLTS